MATRRTTAGAEWRCIRALRSGDADAASAIAGAHVQQPTPLADHLEVSTPEHFRLLGRAADLVNIAGKRSSLGYLNHQLNAIAGVIDGAFWMPPEEAPTSRSSAWSPSSSPRG